MFSFKVVILKLLPFLVIGAFFFVCQYQVDQWRRQTTEKIIQNEDARRIVDAVVEEFRIVSRDLTSCSQAFCTTKNLRFLDRYNDILAWSRGKSTRTKQSKQEQNVESQNAESRDVESRYNGGERNGKKGNKSVNERALQTSWSQLGLYLEQNLSQEGILLQHGVKDDEIKLFQAAVSESDRLSEIELQVMMSINEGKFLTGPLNLENYATLDDLKVSALYDDEYYDFLEKIATHIDTFLSHYHGRVDSEMQDAKRQLSKIEWWMSGIRAFTLILLIAISFYVVKTLWIASVHDAQMRAQYRDAQLEAVFDSSNEGI
ncbi:MAG: hypothetical protein ACRCUY_02135, partial [Thermoguttaceae bacterium]